MALLEANPVKLPRMSDIAKATGISRQALYLHFTSRTDLLVETTRYQDDLLDVNARLAPSRNAATGRARLDAFVTAWGSHIPQVWSLARPLLTLAATEPEAATAMDQRMADVREGFDAALGAIIEDGDLPEGIDSTAATDLIATLMSIPNWESLTQDLGWSQQRYIAVMRAMARTALLGEGAALQDALSQTERLDPRPPAA